MIHFSQRVLSILDTLPLCERQRLAQFNDTALDYPDQAGLHRLIEAQVERTPDALAVQFEHTQYRYSELNQHANRLAHHLRTLGIGPQAKVAICMERSAPVLVALLAVLKAGGVYVPVAPSWPGHRLAEQLRGCRPVLALTLGDSHGTFAAAGVACLDLHADARQWADAPSENLVSVRGDASSARLACVLRSSRAAPHPAWVGISHQALVSVLYALGDEGAVGADDVVINRTCLTHPVAALEMWLALMVGARVVMLSVDAAADTAALARVMAQHKVSVMHAPPETWQRLLDSGWPHLRRPLRVLCSGAPLSADLANRLLDHAPQVWNLYGHTETTLWATYRLLEWADQPVDIGRPLANTRTYVLDAALNRVPLGQPGELYIAGDGLACGYLDRPDLTAEHFLPNPYGAPGSRLYRTGDRVRQRASGHLELLGCRTLEDCVELFPSNSYGGRLGSTG